MFLEDVVLNHCNDQYTGICSMLNWEGTSPAEEVWTGTQDALLSE